MMLSKCWDSLAGSFWESKTTASWPSSFARSRAASARTTNQGLFSVETRTATRWERESSGAPAAVPVGSERLQLAAANPISRSKVARRGEEQKRASIDREEAVRGELRERI